MARALIGLGANLGNCRQTLDLAIDGLRKSSGVQAVVTSRYYRTQPAGGPAGQDTFLNAVARVETTLTAEELLEQLLAIENSLGRVREMRWDRRTLDLDLLLYETKSADEQETPPFYKQQRDAGETGAPHWQSEVIETLRLSVPHPRLAFRRFVLEGAAEVGAQMYHPLLGMNVRQMYEQLDSTPNWIGLVGAESTRPADVAKAVLAQFSDLSGPQLAVMAAGELPASVTNDSSGLPQVPPVQFRDDAGVPLRARGATLLHVCKATSALQWGENAKPRLLVVLEDWTTLVRSKCQDLPPARNTTATDPRIAANVTPPSGEDRAIFDLLASYQGGAILCAGRNDFAWQVSEIVGALKAMQNLVPDTQDAKLQNTE